jgi:hypothetical protein
MFGFSHSLDPKRTCDPLDVYRKIATLGLKASGALTGMKRLEFVTLPGGATAVRPRVHYADVIRLGTLPDI